MVNVDGSNLGKNNGKDRPVVKKDAISEFITVHRVEIEKALPKMIGGFDNFMAAVLNSRRNNVNLGRCTPNSFVCAVMLSVQLGLKPNTPLGQCYIIPYWNSHLKCYEAQFQLGYKGILEMGYRTNEITEIYADKVYKGDQLEYRKGTTKYIDHVERSDRWEYDKETGLPIVTHYYGIYKTTKGGMHFALWPKELVIKHMERFSPAVKSDKFSPWRSNPDLMSQKTVLKDAMRYAPLAENDRRILAADESVKREISKDMLDVPSIYEFSPDDTKGIDDVELEGETDKTDQEPGQKKPGQKTSKDKGAKKGVGQKPRDSKTGPAGKDGNGKEGPGSSKPDAEPGTDPGDPGDQGTPSQDTKAVTEKQIDRMFAMAAKANPEISSEKFKNKVKIEYKLNHLRELVKFQYDQVCDSLQKVLDAQKKLSEETIKDFNEAEKEGKI